MTTSIKLHVFWSDFNFTLLKHCKVQRCLPFFNFLLQMSYFAPKFNCNFILNTHVLWNHKKKWNEIIETILYTRKYTGADPGFQVRGVDLKKLRRAEGGAKFFVVFRVKNLDFAQKNHIFYNFRDGARRVRPPWIRPWYTYKLARFFVCEDYTGSCSLLSIYAYCLSNQHNYCSCVCSME